MPRLFTGLEVPRQVRDHLALLQSGLPGARWIDPDNFHVTLRFIGDVDGSMAREVVCALDQVERAPMTLTIEGLGAFGGNKPHSLQARVRITPDLLALQAEQERMMQRLGLPAERRSYTPHVTLARCRGLQPGAVAHWLQQRGGIMQLAFDVERFVLFSSRDSVGGGPYVIEDDYPLIPSLVA
ncbi:MAG: RNA 2',3'-cyclic phosphodiesterase [Pseudomonadota bacterium]